MDRVIYQIRNLVNGKLYIGSTKNFKYRRGDHIRSLRKSKSGCKALQNAWNKYGEDSFIFEIIYYVPLDMDIVWAEEQFIDFFDTVNNGYNIKLPFTQQNQSEDSYDRTSKNGSESTLKWLVDNAPSQLKKISKEEWLIERKKNPKFRLSDIPTKYTKESKYRSVIKVSSTGDILEVFSNCYMAQAKYGIVGNSNIYSCCTKNKSKGIGKHMSYGFYWFFEGDFDKQAFLKLFIPKNKVIIPYRERKVKRTPITIQNIETEEILNFQSIVECSEYLKVNKVKIHDLIRGRRNKGRGVFSKVGSIKGYRLYGGL
jgi:group I intron endonuclease